MRLNWGQISNTRFRSQILPKSGFIFKTASKGRYCKLGVAHTKRKNLDTQETGACFGKRFSRYPAIVVAQECRDSKTFNLAGVNL